MGSRAGGLTLSVLFGLTHPERTDTTEFAYFQLFPDDTLPSGLCTGSRTRLVRRLRFV
ncbi:hypothetical protein D3C71_2214180 [compost metagenome]